MVNSVVSAEDRRGPQPPRQISPSLLPNTMTVTGFSPSMMHASSYQLS